MLPNQHPGPAAPGGPDGTDGVVLTPEEHAEYRRLRGAAAVHHRRARWTGASLLLVVALLLSPLAVVAAWVDSEVSDTGRYVQTVAPLASDPAVQAAVTDRLTGRVVENVDVEAVTAALSGALADAGAPPAVVDRSQALAGPLSAAVTNVVHGVVDRVVTGDVFAAVWETANRRAHAAVVAMLTGGDGGALSTQGDTVRLDLGPVVDEVTKRLADAGFEKAAAIPTPDRQITLFETEKLSEAQAAVRVLDVMGTWLPVLTVAVAALAVWTAPAHRTMLLVTAAGTGVAMVVLLVGLAVVRRVYLDAVPASSVPPDAAAAIYDTFVRFLRDSTRTLIVVAVITALAAYLYGPGRTARAVRSLAGRSAAAAGRALERGGVRTGPTGRWLHAHRPLTTGAVLAAAVLTLLLWNHPTVAAVALVLCVVLAVLALLAVLAEARGRAPAAAGAGHGAGP